MPPINSGLFGTSSRTPWQHEPLDEVEAVSRRLLGALHRQHAVIDPEMVVAVTEIVRAWPPVETAMEDERAA